MDVLPLRPTWMLDVSLGIPPRRQKPPPQSPTIMNGVYVTLVRFKRKTSVVFGYVHAKITPGCVSEKISDPWFSVGKNQEGLVKFRHKIYLDCTRK